MPRPPDHPTLAPLIDTDPCFTDEECARIIAEGMALPMRAGEITGRETTPDARKSTVAFFPSEQRHAWMVERIAKLVLDLNQKLWRFEIARSDLLQFSAYGEGQYYDWHMDLASRGTLAVRKLSISVQLNDSADYDGGDLEVDIGAVIKLGSRRKGALVVFPSYMRHRVLPITRGTRYSLVAWFGGSTPFR